MGTGAKGRRFSLTWAGALLSCVLVIVAACTGQSGPTPTQGATSNPTASVTPAASASRTPTPAATHRSTPSPTLQAIDPYSGRPWIDRADLPREAIETLDLIDAGGPFPYRSDGITFENREGILPAKPKGYYHEYTVVTPGSDDRGARRIVTGNAGEAYYTDDHYDSFSRIRLP
jgi:ribonuclease T1